MRSRTPLLAAIFAAAGLWAQETTLPFAIGEWAPYTGAALPGHGAAAAVVDAACSAAGLKAAFSFYPWNRAETLVADGRAFAAFPYLRLPEREAKHLFSETLFPSSIGILRHASNARAKAFEYAGPASFKGCVVGTTAGTKAVEGPLAKAGVAVEATPLIDQSVVKLQAGRVDFVVEERSVLIDSIRRLFPDQAGDFSFLDKDFIPRGDYLLLVSKAYPKAPELLARFNGGLRKIKADGTLKKIYAKYGIAE